MKVMESRQQPNRFARQLFDGLPDRYDRLAEVLSMGQNGRWRRAMVDAIVAGSTRRRCSTWPPGRPASPCRSPSAPAQW